jgi:RND family efflux transporter MFP subunit
MSEEKPKPRSFPGKVFFILKFLEVRLRFVAILVVTALVVGYWDHIQNYYERYQREHQAARTEVQGAPSQTEASQSEVEYYCGMHPFVVRDRQGKCPICGMDLVERKKGAPTTLPEGTLARVQVSPQRIAQAGIQVEAVLYRLLTRTLRSYGVAEAEEKRISKISARFSGRIQELTVNTLGAVVKKGDPLAKIYSPKYLAASQEYVRALTSNAKEALPSNPEMAALEKGRSQQMVIAARNRLSLAGFTEAQLDAIAENGKVNDTVTLYAPQAGTVIEKSVLLGETVEEGTVLFTVADLGELWVQVKVPEADLGAVGIGMPVEITTVAWPGKIFYGNVEFISPVLDEANRTVKVRVAVANPDGKLKPGMYANAVIRSPIGQFNEEGGAPEAPKVVAAFSGGFPTAKQADADNYVASLKDGAEYYACPMDAQVVSDTAGKCPVCGMNLEAKKRGEQAPVDMSLPTKTQEDADKYLSSIGEGAAYFTCSMHTEVVSDRPGECPLCGGMKLEEKKKEASTAFAGTEIGTMERWTEGYACPMHPDELSDTAGVCRTCNCGMVMKKWKVERVLSVPESAVIDTGTRKIVYVETQSGVYDARAVTLDNRVGAYYPVIDGLAAGQRIVSQGSFLVDAEARLNPSTPKAAEGTSSGAAAAK